MRNTPTGTASLVLMLACASLFPLRASAADAERYQILFGADWLDYGLYSMRPGFGYNTEASRIFRAGHRIEIAAGGRVAYFPNERAYAWTNGSQSMEYPKDNRLFYAGIPLTARYRFTAGDFAPFVELKNTLDVRVLQKTKDRGFSTYCYGTSPQTCIEEEDFHEIAVNDLLVWRQSISLGMRFRLGATSLLLGEGILWDVTPERSANAYFVPRREFYLSSFLGLSF